MEETVETTAVKGIIKKLDRQPLYIVVMLMSFAFSIYIQKTVADEYKEEIKICRQESQECQSEVINILKAEIVNLLQRKQ